jgi:SAM-dependent methyltransferase
MTAQKDLFLATEGDQWLRRNRAVLSARDFSRDPLCLKVSACAAESRLKILEVGCSDGSRLADLAGRYGHHVSGIDPSGEAVSRAAAVGVRAVQGTADKLPFADGAFDAVMFGFCLYLCDDSDLFRIAMEADRVLASPGWLLILDFDARAPTYRDYAHLAGVRSRKMDYKSMFQWHPAFTLVSYDKFHHGTQHWTDDEDEWVSCVCMRKNRV